MRIQQFILLTAGVVLVVLLFVFGVTKPPEKEKNDTVPVKENGSVAEIDFPTILEKAKGSLNNNQRDTLEAIELQLKKVRGNKEQAEMLKSVGNAWQKTGNVLVAGKYFAEAAAISKDKASLEKAANLFYSGFSTTSDTLARRFGAQEGIKVFKDLAKMDPGNTEYPIHEAICYVEGLGMVMPGVSLLKEVEKKEPDNKEMNLILGRLAIVSGQYDKAITRLEKLTKLDPANVEVYINLAEAYRAVGRRNDAVKSLEQCKSLVNDPAFNARIDSYIKQIKNP